ncbi:hypothetical protein GCM10017673_39790 [Streptosporangium violaceochromogenes]|nr:hypothetical protein GCM10017673_39790 [Streptosporangium violaceochromogenes]
MTEDRETPQTAQVTAESTFKVRIRRLSKFETAGIVASNSSGN